MVASKISILENLCRTCMGGQETGVIAPATRQKSKSLISIYHEHETKDSGHINVIELLKQSSPQLTVETNDLLPKCICEDCLSTMVNIHEFQKKSLKVEQTLHGIIKEHYSSHELDVDPLNNNLKQSDGGEDLRIEIDEPLIDVTSRCEDLRIEIDEPLIDVTTPVKGFFTLLQKDGQIIEVYNDLEKCRKESCKWNDKCDTDDDGGDRWKTQCDTAVRDARNIDNKKLSDVRFWKYIDVDNQDKTQVNREQCSKIEGFVGGGVNGTKRRHEREGERLGKSSRILRKSKRNVEISDDISAEINDQNKICDDEEVDSERKHQATRPTSNKIKEVPEEESVESEVSDSSETIVGDNRERQSPLDESKRFKCKSIKNVTELEANQQDNLKLKNEEKTVVSVKLDYRGFPCDECGERLKTLRGLQMHLKGHLNNKQKQHIAENGLICPECGARLKTRVTFRRHLLMHEKDETKIKYKCQYCNKGYYQSSALRHHVRMHTGERPYLCSICGKSFATQNSLKQHCVRHGTEFKYQCPECPKRFRCLSSMSTHKAIVHCKIRPHVCDVCGASFKKPYALRTHKIIHGEKKHKCDYCEVKFAQLDQCRRHMRTHTGEKPYKCRYCERAYAQSNDMIKHLRVHLGDNVYRCEMCPQAFRLLCELRVHFASHKDDDEQTKLQNLRALKEEEERIQAKIERSQLAEQQSS